MYLFYSFLYNVALFFLLPFEYLKRPKELRKRWLREKFGFLHSEFGIRNSEFIWIHAVSVGEVMAALPLLKRLRDRFPTRGIILTTITDTGQKVAREKAPEGTTVLYLPFDTTFALKAALKKMRPEIFITIETELWPNIFKVFKEYGIPVVMLNGRISENSLRGYKKISFFMKKVLSCVDLFCMQSEIDAKRIKNFGVDEKKIKVLGNFKFDTKPPSEIPEWAERMKRPVIIAGSTHQGEEELITSVYGDLKRDFPDLNLIIAPRHPERFKEVEDMLRSRSISFIKRSSLSSHHLGPPPSPSPPEGEGRGEGETSDSELQTFNGTVILLDAIGELSSVYGKADIAIIGKSFRGYGGQNPLEPAYWGKPILCGPHMENFPFIEDFYSEGAAIEVLEENLYPKLRDLLLSPEKAREMGLKAKDLYMKNSGAVERAIEVISGYIHN